MIAEPECFKRNCMNYIGTKNDGDEMTERVYCKAFKNRIPNSIAYGNNLHLTPLSDQENDIVFEKG